LGATSWNEGAPFKGRKVSKERRRPRDPGGRESVAPVVIWKGREYERLDRGRREVRVVEVQGPEWVRRYRRWSLRVGCQTLDEPGKVSAFLNLGKDPNRPSMGTGRQSRIYKLVTLAKGEPPRNGERIDFEALLLGKCFLVQIDDCTKNSRGEKKTEGETYSCITDFVRLTGP
jgi:hypothetical protein